MVVPVFNEEAALGGFVVAARAAGDALVGEGLVSEVEIVLVDDASTDATARIAADLAAVDPRVRVVRHEHNRGLGASVRSSVLIAFFINLLSKTSSITWS